MERKRTYHPSRVASALLPAAAISLMATAALADDEAVYNSCKKDLQLSDSGCQCVVEEMHSTLNDNQREVFVELIRGNNSAMIAAQSSGKLTADDMTVLTNFMTTTPSRCQSQ